jgi:hypothetical protein
MTSTRKLHAYEVLWRMAKVRELQAAMDLALAANEECLRRVERDGLSRTQELVAAAQAACLATSAVLDMGRFEMLAQLSEGVGGKLQTASQQLSLAVKSRDASATSNVLAKRYRERVSERVDVVSAGLHHATISAEQHEAVELWLHGRSEP